MSSSEDALLAQLLGMGFELGEIEECQRAMAGSEGGTFSVQAATEWLLQRQQRTQQPVTSSSQPSNQRLVLTTPPGITTETTPTSELHDYQRAISSSADFTTSSWQQEPLKSRYTVSEDHVREKERFAAKERQEAVKRAKEMRAAEMKARHQVKKRIAEDRKARQDKFGSQSKKTEVPTKDKPSPVEAPPTDHTPKPPTAVDVCRVQVRLPNGRMLRHNFPPSATLDDVATFVMESTPHVSSVTLVQPFPHHEFSPQELQQSLLSLGLCPSASLVVSKHARQEVGGASSVAMDTQHQRGPSSTKDFQFGPKRAHFEKEQLSAAQSHIEGSRGQPGMSGRGHVLGHGSHDPTAGSPSREEEMNIDREPEDEAMDIGGSHSHSSDEEEDIDEDIQQPFPHMPPPHQVPPQAGGRFQLPPPGGRGRQIFGGPPGGGMFIGGGGDDDMFGGSGHRLGGKDAPPVFGDLQRQQERMHEAAESAAVKRSHVVATPLTPPSPHHPHIPTLESLCTRTLVTVSRTYGLPSCSSLSPLVGQRLMAALTEEKRLNTKTLASFHGCPLQVLNLDNYAYATNELLSALVYFPSLIHLSLGSCTIITDKAVVGLFPYLSGLTYLNLNGCRQLNEPICRAIRVCKSLEVLKLSQVKISDRGISLLLHHPLETLRELDLSHTLITSRSLELLQQGTPNLEVLTIESTKVNDLSSLSRLPRLHSLSVAHCHAPMNIGSLHGCHGLQSLNLAGVTVETSELKQLAGLCLHSLTLPDRNTFFDGAMEVVCGFPLASLDLMDYCHVTDVGLSHLPSLHPSLSTLSLSRTKLTDHGMVFLEGLHRLRELSLDNTLVTDEGMRSISGLVGLDVLSLSDTRVTSQFILDGVLDNLSMLTKLNLSRTAVCDRGISRLRLGSLVMLNLNWTCVTEACNLEYTRENGCPLLETLRNRNIGQLLPGQQHPNNENPI